MPSSRSVGLNIVIAGDAKGASKAMRQVQGEVTGLDKATKGVASSVGQLFVAYQGTQFLRGAAEASASLAESQNTANQVFGDSVGIVSEFGAAAVEGIGQSERMATQAANAFGGLLVNMGLSQEQAAEWSTTLVALGSDLGASWDKPVQQALDAIRSGLSGETEPLKQFGIDVSDAGLRAEAAAQGIDLGTGALTRNQKANLAYSAILRQSAASQGAFTRESDGLLQRQQQLSAEWETAKANLGEGLMPAIQLATTGAMELTQAWGSIPGGFQAGTLALGAAVLILPKLYAGYRSAAEAVTMFRLGLAGVTEKGAGASNALGGLIGKVGGVGVALGGAAVAGAIFAKKWSEDAEDARHKAEQVADAMGAIDAALGRLPKDSSVSEVVDAAAVDLATQKWAEYGDELKGIGISGPDALRKVLDGSDPIIVELLKMRAVSEGTFGDRGLAGDVASWAESLQDGEGKTKRTREAQQALGDETEVTTGAIKSQTSAIGSQKSAMDRFNDAVAERRTKLDNQRSATESLSAAQRETVLATAAEAEAVRAAAGDSDEYRNALESAATAEAAIGDAREGVTEALANVQDSEQALSDARAEASERLKQLAKDEVTARRARLDSIEAQHDAEQELRRVIADPTASAEQKRDAQYELSKANEEVATRTQEEKDATKELTDARNAGIEGDRGVVDAKKKVAEANQAVRDAEKQVQEAVENAARAQEAAKKVITDAKDAVAEAARRTRDAQLEEADAVGQVGEAYGGANAGALFQIAALEKLRDTVAPGSDLRRYLDEYIAQLQTVLDPSPSGVASLGASAPPGAVNAERSLRGGRGGTTVVQNIRINDTPKGARRAFNGKVKQEMDALARGTR